MVEHVALYVLSGSKTKADSVLDQIRASDFIDEVNSGEGPREECGLYKLVKAVDATVTTEEEALQDLTKRVEAGDGDIQWNKFCMIVAGEDGDEVVTAVQIRGKDMQVKDKLKCKARSVIEVVSNEQAPMFSCTLLICVPPGVQLVCCQYVDRRGK